MKAVAQKNWLCLREILRVPEVRGIYSVLILSTWSTTIFEARSGSIGVVIFASCCSFEPTANEENVLTHLVGHWLFGLVRCCFFLVYLYVWLLGSWWVGSLFAVWLIDWLSYFSCTLLLFSFQFLVDLC